MQSHEDKRKIPKCNVIAQESITLGENKIYLNTMLQTSNYFIHGIRPLLNERRIKRAYFELI